MTVPKLPADSRDRSASLAALILAVFGLLLLVFLHVVVVERFRVIFVDLFEGQKLPAMTTLVLSMPRPVAALAAALAIGLLAWKEIAMENKHVSMLINIGAIGIAIGLAVCAGVALFLPLLIIVTNLSH